MRELGAILRANPQHAHLKTLPLPRFSSRSLRVLLNNHNQPSGTQSTVGCAHRTRWTPMAADDH